MRRVRVKMVWAVIGASVLAMALSALAAESTRKLNAPLPAGAYVDAYEHSPDGRHIVYSSAYLAPGPREIFSVPTTGGPAVRLHPPLPAGGSVDNFHVSPDGRFVIYTADQRVDEVHELWSVPIEGPASASVPLSAPLVAGGGVSTFAISPDSTRVIYRAEQRVDEMHELWSVPIEGPANASVPLNTPLVAGGDVLYFRLSPDSTRVVYHGDQRVDGTDELWSVPIAGPSDMGVPLTPLLVTGSRVFSFQISPDSTRVVYQANQQDARVLELWSVPLAGPASAGVRLDAPLVTDGSVSSFQISPDGARVVYSIVPRKAEAHELWSVPISGPVGENVPLSLRLPATQRNARFLISPDSRRLVYLVDWRVKGLVELISVPLTGPVTQSVVINPALTPGGDVKDFAISPDSTRIIYQADQRADEVFELFSTPLSGGMVTPLNAPLVPGGDVDNFRISPDSGRVIFTADQQTNDAFGLYAVPINGPASAQTTLKSELPIGRRLYDFEPGPSGNWVTYVSDEAQGGNLFELYLAGDLPQGPPATPTTTATTTPPPVPDEHQVFLPLL